MLLMSWLSLCHGLKAVFQIRQNVIDMLDADGETNGARGDAGLLKFLLRQLGMGGGGRMNHQTLHICRDRDDPAGTDD